MNKRLVIVDVMKAICIISVIFGHIAQNDGLDSIMQFFYTFHMPLFFMISGYFINIENKTISNYIISKARRLLKPYILACIILIVIKSIAAYIDNQDYLSVFIKWIWISIYGNGSGSGTWFYSLKEGWIIIDEIGMLWFLLALFWGSIIVFIILKFFKNYKYVFIYIIIISFIGVYSSKYICLPFSLQNGLAVSFWIYIGYFLKRNKEELLLNSHKMVNFTILITSWFISIFFGQTWLFCNYYKLSLIDILGSIGGSYVIYRLAKSIMNISLLTQFFSFVGKNSLVFYIIHFILEKSINILNPTYLISSFYEANIYNQFLLAGLLSCLICFL